MKSSVEHGRHTRPSWVLGYLVGATLLLLSVAACSTRPSPAPTPTATDTPIAATPTARPFPTPTVVPTSTPLPTATSTPKPTSVWKEALSAAHNGDCEKAIPLLKEVIRQAEGERADNARYRLGACYALTGDWDEALTAWQSVSPASEWHAPSSFLAGEALLHTGHPSEARDAFTTYLTATHAITDVVWARVASSYAIEGKMEKAKDAWEQAVAAAPDVYTRVSLREDAIDALEKAGMYEDAAAWYRAILTEARNERYRTEIWRRLGDAFWKAGKEKDAEKAWTQAVLGDEKSPHAYAALLELVERGVPVDDYRRGIIDYAHGAYTPAIKALARYVASGRKAHADDARIYLALAWGAQGRPDRARATLKPLLTSSRTSDRFVKGMQALSDAYANAGHWREAHDTLVDLSEKASSPETKAGALWQAGKIALEHENYLLASKDISRLVSKFPNASPAPKGLFVLGLGAYRFGLYPAAEAAFKTLLERYPDFDPDRTHFWLGLAAAKEHKPEMAKAEWSAISAGYGYYPAMARRQGAALGIPLPTPAPPDADCSADPLPTPPAPNESWRRSVALLRVGLREEAYRAFRSAVEAYRGDPVACAGAAKKLASLGEYRVSVSCARKALRAWQGPPPCALYRLAYPAYYGDIVLEESHAQGVDPFLVLALIRQESHFSTYAGSSAGAQGLMQLMPATARWVATKEKEPDPSGMLSVPVVNVHLGTVFLKMNLELFDGNEEEALAAYNAGYVAIVRWRSAYGDDGALLADALPIDETREYVRQVVAQKDYYTKLYSGEFPAVRSYSEEDGLLPIELYSEGRKEKEK